MAVTAKNIGTLLNFCKMQGYSRKAIRRHSMHLPGMEVKSLKNNK